MPEPLIAFHASGSPFTNGGLLVDFLKIADGVLILRNQQDLPLVVQNAD